MHAQSQQLGPRYFEKACFFLLTFIPRVEIIIKINIFFFTYHTCISQIYIFKCVRKNFEKLKRTKGCVVYR